MSLQRVTHTNKIIDVETIPLEICGSQYNMYIISVECL